MIKNALVLIIGLCMIFLQGCGILNPEQSGTLYITFEKNVPNRQLAKSPRSLDAAQYVIRQRNILRRWSTLTKEENHFIAEIAPLEPGSDYSVLLYGRKNGSIYIITTAYHSGIEIEEEKITVVEMSWTPFKVVLTTPVRRDTLRENTLYFEWNPVHGAEAYQLMVDDDSTFWSPIISPIVTDEFYEVGDQLFENGTYYFRIKCRGRWKMDTFTSDQRWGEWSDTSTFTILHHPSAR